MALKEAIADVVETAKSFLSEDQPASQPSTDAIELLKADHRRVEALFQQILQEQSLALVAQRANIEKVLAELTLHAKIEETIFYPAVYGKTKKDTGRTSRCPRSVRRARLDERPHEQDQTR